MRTVKIDKNIALTSEAPSFSFHLRALLKRVEGFCLSRLKIIASKHRKLVPLFWHVPNALDPILVMSRVGDESGFC